MYRRLTDDDSKRCLELLFVKLDEFLDERDPSLAVPPSAD
jgi:hypothetical protein